MNIFKNRPLSLILSIILSGLSLCFIKSHIAFAIILSLAVASLLVFIFYKRLRLKKLVTVCLAAFIIAAVLFRLYFGLMFYPSGYSDNESLIEATVDTVENDSESFKSLIVKINSINGNNTLNYKSSVYIYNSNQEFNSGNKIRFVGEIECIDFKNDSYNIAKGISSYVYADEIEIVDKGTPTLTAFFASVRESIKNYTQSITDEESASLLNALLLGEREELDPEATLGFKRSGITHILALSGMHLVILSTAIRFLLRRFGINKRVAIVVTMVFVVAFMALVGFPSSVVRAGVMLLISSLVYLLTGCKDNLTSLLLAFVLILLVQPHLIFDISLWLSALSTLGILVCQEYVGTKYDPGFKISKLMLGVKTSLLFSLFAISTTYAIAVIFFDTSSIFAPIATLIVGFLSNIYVYAGLITLMLGALLPIGGMLRYIRIVIEAIVSAFSSVEFASFSVSNIFIKILGIALTLLILTFFVIKTNHRKIAVAVIASLYLFINIFGIALCADAKSGNSILYQSYGNEVMLVSGNGDACFVDFGESNVSSSYNNANFAYENDICSIDSYCLLNYSDGSIDSIVSLLAKIKIDSIKVPHPSNGKELSLLERLVEGTEGFSCSVDLYDPDEEINMCGFELLMITESDYSYNLEELAFVIAHGDKMYGYASASALVKSKLAESLFYTCEGVIIGDFGDSISEDYKVDLSSQRLKFAIISSDSVSAKSNNGKAFYQKEAEITP